jgi:hypothetical protein
MECQAITPCSDPLDDEEIWHSLIMDYIRLPMNYGSDIGGVRPLARAPALTRTAPSPGY